jgi:hypothetical protein
MGVPTAIAVHPTISRAQLRRGARQSIPSSSIDNCAGVSTTDAPAINRYLGEHNRKPKPFVCTADPTASSRKSIAGTKRSRHTISKALHCSSRFSEPRSVMTGPGRCRGPGGYVDAHSHPAPVPQRRALRRIYGVLGLCCAAKPGEIAWMTDLLASDRCARTAGFEHLIFAAVLIAYATGCAVTIGVHTRLWLQGEYRDFPTRIALMSIIFAVVFWPVILFFLAVRKKQ